jgi:hypothetical protein
MNLDAPLLQRRGITLTILIQIKDARAHDLVTQTADKIRDLLTGFNPQEFRPLYQVSGRFEDYSDDYWTYSMKFAVPSAFIKQPER